MPKLPEPEIYTNKARQIRGMISFATKAERAYRSIGDTANADQAKAHREKLEQDLKNEEE